MQVLVSEHDEVSAARTGGVVGVLEDVGDVRSVVAVLRGAVDTSRSIARTQ